MSDLLMAVLVILVPTWAACTMFVAWAGNSASSLLATILRISGLLCAAVLTLCFAVIVAITADCSGNVLYGFGQCDCLPMTGSAATTLTSLSLLTYGLGILYGALLLIVAGVWEVLTRRRSPAK
ncbi:hypothetical protein [Gymnodinialimonas hymeniacidonis]|uniref:hypothetical protein n=1 Tax=Gymnodinialimonas hymeniacidonis TaxID=3126508 RepID=UPI0034C6A0AD